MQGAFTATSNYPVAEVPAHHNQLGDLSLFHDKPLLRAGLYDQRFC